MRYVALQGERWDNIAFKVFGDAYKVTVILAINDIEPKLLTSGGEVLNLPIHSEEEISTPEAVPLWLSS